MIIKDRDARLYEIALSLLFKYPKNTIEEIFNYAEAFLSEYDKRVTKKQSSEKGCHNCDKQSGSAPAQICDICKGEYWEEIKK